MVNTPHLALALRINAGPTVSLSVRARDVGRDWPSSESSTPNQGYLTRQYPLCHKPCPTENRAASMAIVRTEHER